MAESKKFVRVFLLASCPAVAPLRGFAFVACERRPMPGLCRPFASDGPHVQSGFEELPGAYRRLPARGTVQGSRTCRERWYKREGDLHRDEGE